MNAESENFFNSSSLNSTENRYRLIIENITDYAIFLLDTAGHVITWNAGAQRIKQYQATEIIGKHCSIFYPEEVRARNYPAYELQEAQQQGRFEDEGWRVRKDGIIFWAHNITTPFYYQGKTLAGFSKITRDLSERSRQEDLMRQNNELVRINNDLDNFVYTASHDLKSPVGNLEGLLNALEQDLGAGRENHTEVLGMMKSSIITLKNVINDLSDISKLRQDKVTSQTVHIPTLLEEIKESLRPLIVENNTEIIVQHLEFENLKYPRKNLRSVLYNLVSNAVKYTDPQRRPQIIIKTFISDTGEYVLSVADNGLGIAENQMDKIFSMYKRVHAHIEGSGIGLYLVKKILENSGDTITVKSELSKGSVFHVYFKQ